MLLRAVSPCQIWTAFTFISSLPWSCPMRLCSWSSLQRPCQLKKPIFVPTAGAFLPQYQACRVPLTHWHWHAWLVCLVSAYAPPCDSTSHDVLAVARKPSIAIPAAIALSIAMARVRAKASQWIALAIMCVQSHADGTISVGQWDRMRRMHVLAWLSIAPRAPRPAVKVVCTLAKLIARCPSWLEATKLRKRWPSTSVTLGCAGFSLLIAAVGMSILPIATNLRVLLVKVKDVVADGTEPFAVSIMVFKLLRNSPLFVGFFCFNKEWCCWCQYVCCSFLSLVRGELCRVQLCASTTTSSSIDELIQFPLSLSVYFVFSLHVAFCCHNRTELRWEARHSVLKGFICWTVSCMCVLCFFPKKVSQSILCVAFLARACKLVVFFLPKTKSVCFTFPQFQVVESEFEQTPYTFRSWSQKSLFSVFCLSEVSVFLFLCYILTQ